MRLYSPKLHMNATTSSSSLLDYTVRSVDIPTTTASPLPFDIGRWRIRYEIGTAVSVGHRYISPNMNLYPLSSSHKPVSCSALSDSLLLPEDFGNIYLGQNFTSYISLSNHR
jgi:hypothetical protein